MSKVSGRTELSFRREQARRPDERFLRKRAFEKRTLPEPPRLKRPRTYLLGRSPLKAFYYTKGVKGKWHTARRVTDGTGWNAFLCSGTAIPKGTAPAIYQAPPAVKGLLSSLKTAKETSFSSGHIAPQEVHAAPMPAHSMEMHIMHFHPPSGTGWVDVPMPGMQTQYQQGAFVHLEIAPHHKHGSYSHAAQEQPQVPTATVSLISIPGVQPHQPTVHGSDMNTIAFGIAALAPAQEPAYVRPPGLRVQECASHDANVPEPRTGPVAADYTGAPATSHLSESLLPHFSQARAGRPQEKAPAAKTHRGNPKPREFHAVIPRGEEIRKAPEQAAQAAAPPAEYRALQIRVADMPASAHIGYIPSVKKKEIQLKVAQGAEAVPPQ